MERWQSLLQFLEQDPDNVPLIADAANAAFDAGELETARGLLERHRALAGLPLPLINLEGLVALRLHDLDGAATAFDALLQAGVDEPSVRFNRAWVHALHEEHEAALALLDDDTVAVTERAAALKVQTLHHLGQIEEALAVGQGMAERFPGNDSLLGALSVAAMDADDMALARHYAGQAQGGSDALTTRGLIALNDSNPADSLALFDQALALHPEAPRAWIGKGLGLVATGDTAGGAAALRKGAEIFGDHLGSWIALGWTQFTSRDLAGARQTFEHALSLDDNFAETHGGLAVLDVAEGNLESATRRADIALRLDRECFGGMLAKLLLAEAKGSAATAQRIWDKAMNVAVGAEGQTLAQAMSGLGLDPGKMRPRRGGDGKS
jgi:tetratricopeptide (TPR) repeat protein